MTTAKTDAATGDENEIVTGDVITAALGPLGAKEAAKADDGNIRRENTGRLKAPPQTTTSRSGHRRR